MRMMTTIFTLALLALTAPYASANGYGRQRQVIVQQQVYVPQQQFQPVYVPQQQVFRQKQVFRQRQYFAPQQFNQGCYQQQQFAPIYGNGFQLEVRRGFLGRRSLRLQSGFGY